VPSDSYGTPAAVPSSSYGTPIAVPSDSYGTPAAVPSDSYGTPEAAPSSSYEAAGGYDSPSDLAAADVVQPVLPLSDNSLAEYGVPHELPVYGQVHHPETVNKYINKEMGGLIIATLLFSE
jgi:hypothetical protein